MNDLAEKALQGLDVTRRQVRGHPMLSFGVLGFVLSAAAVVAGGRVGAVGAARPLTTWLALQDPDAPQHDTLAASGLLVAVLALALTWVAVVRFLGRRPQLERRVWAVAVAWAAPFALGPPLSDTNVYSYAAFGLVQRAGHNPYTSSPMSLGDGGAVAAIDPAARGTVSGVGPLATLLQHLAVSVGRGSALGAVIALRVLAVVVVVWLGRLSADMGGRHRDRALALCVLNPLVLLYLVSGAHLDGLMIALVLVALSAANQRRWMVAVAAAAGAGSVAAPGLVAVPIVIAVHVFGRRRLPDLRAGALTLGRDAVVAAAVLCVFGFGVPHGFGWIETVGKQFTTHTPYSIAGAVATVLTPFARGASYDDLAIGGRLTAVTAMVCVLGYLLATVRQRAIERSVGYALLAIGLLAPVLWPWYLLWGTLCLAPSAYGERRMWVLALTLAGCTLSIAGVGELTANTLTGILLALLAAAVVLTLRARSRWPVEEDEPQWPPVISRTAGRTSAK